MMLRGSPAYGQSLVCLIFKRAGKAFWLVSLFAGCGFATPLAASCKTASWSSMQPFMEAFVLDPTAILQVFPSGGDKMFYGLEDYLAADARLVLPSVIKLIRTANAEQKKSIGHALGTAVYQCRYIDPETSHRVEMGEKKIRDQIVLRAYSDALHQEEDEASQPLGGEPASEANWPGSGLSVTEAPGKTLGANSFKLRLWDPAKQNSSTVTFLPQAR